MADGELYRNMYPVLKKSAEEFDKVCSGFEDICKVCDESLRVHIRAKWLNYAYTINSLYEWYVAVFEAKLAYDKNDVQGYVALVEKAAECLEFNLKFRKNAEYGEFENWYRGEILSDVKKLLSLTNRLICRS